MTKLEMTGIRDGTKALSAQLPGSFPITWAPEDRSTMETLRFREVNNLFMEEQQQQIWVWNSDPLSPGALNLHFLGVGTETWNW